jgi:maltose alpha-D-glucosyltransferase/alpha-amylase
MVTDDERDYMLNEYAIDPRSRINLGIRRRLAPLVDNSRRRIELLTSLLLSLHGTPVMYYGDEIGMGDNIYLGDRNGVRTPMQWNGDRNAGFSRADVHALYTPLVADPVYGYQAVNVEAQQRVPGSLLNWMKRIIRVRKSYPVFGRGSQTFLRPENRRVLAYLREHEGGEILCVANLSRFAQYVELDLSRFAGRTPVELIGRVHFPRIGELPYLLTLGPHDFLWFELT